MRMLRPSGFARILMTTLFSICMTVTAPGLVAAQEPTREEVERPREPSLGVNPAPVPGIESLLHLPKGFTESAPEKSVAGASESVWRGRFQQANTAIEEAYLTLEETKSALDNAADGGGSSQWAIAPPGASGGGGAGGGPAGANSPVSFKLRQALKQNRRDLEAVKKSMKELMIEADLAGVPATWRGERVLDGDRLSSEVGQLLD